MRRFFTTFISQVIAGLTPVFMTVWIARASSPETVGRYAILVAVATVAVGILRGYSTDLLQFSPSSYAPDDWRVAVRRSTAINLLLGLSAGAAVVCIAMFLPRNWALDVAAMAFLIVGLSAHEHLRIGLITAGRTTASMAVEVVGAASVAFAAVAVSKPDVFSVFIAWASVSTLCSIIALAILRLTPSFQLGISWLKNNWVHGSVYASDYAVTAGVAQSVVLIVAASAGVNSAAALRGAQVLTTPITLVTRAATAATASIIVRRVGNDDRSGALRVSAAFSGSVALAAASCAAWLFIPRKWLEILLGDTAGLATDALIPTSIALGMMGIAMGAGFYLRAQGLIRAATRIKFICAPISLAGASIGAALAGAPGSQIGLATGEFSRSVLSWRKVTRT